jgi:molybdopterin molybdotransferase
MDKTLAKPEASESFSLCQSKKVMPDLLEVAAALQKVLQHAAPLQAVECDLTKALQHILAAPVISDIDSPPYDKSMMDGYAVRAQDVTPNGTTLPISQHIMAGMPAVGELQPRTAAQIMTGAPIPPGSDAVIMVERTVSSDGDSVTLNEVPRTGQNILRRATSIAMGQTVLESGEPLTPARMGLCAEVGAARVKVHRQPSVAILSTGDELVGFTERPGPGQIRNSNSLLLAAAVQDTKCDALPLGIARDEPAALRAAIQRGLESDVLILSGGVSAGVLDLVPATLTELGVLPVFHKIRMKPGKPLWFGYLPRAGETPRLVFGLPGNPVSSAVCFELFVKPALRRLRGENVPLEQQFQAARLANEVKHRSDRPTYVPAVWVLGQSGPSVRTLPWSGSADLKGFARYECLVLFPPGEKEYLADEIVQVLL